MSHHEQYKKKQTQKQSASCVKKTVKRKRNFDLLIYRDFFNQVHPKEGNTSTETQGFTGCVSIKKKNRSISEDREQKKSN